MKNKKITFNTLAQSLYLTVDLFIQNGLNDYASACSYGFLFSFVPIVMMVLFFLIGIFHASPEKLSIIFNIGNKYKELFNVQAIIDSIFQIQRITWVEIILGFFIFWVARKFFASVMAGIRAIFKTAVPPRPLFNQLLVFAGEVAIVIAGAILIFFIISLRTVSRLSILKQMESEIPVLFSNFSQITIGIGPYILIFGFMSIVLRVASGIHPEWTICFACAGLCSLLIWIIIQFFTMFLNVNNYNIVYGVLGNLMILLVEMYIFFVLFLFFAQLLYVLEFFDELLIGELYLLPTREETGILSTIKRVLFIKPSLLIQKSSFKKIHCTPGDVIYNANEKTTDTYYIVRGQIQLTKKNSINYYDTGSFFGELSCIINKEREYKAIARIETDLLVIDEKTFRHLLKHNPKVSIKAMAQISDYLREVYGRSR